MILLYHDPKGEAILNNTNYSNTIGIKPIPCTAEAERILQLEQKLNTLKSAAQNNHAVGVLF